MVHTKSYPTAEHRSRSHVWLQDRGVQERSLMLAPASALPVELQQAPAIIQEAYRFELARPGVLRQAPCYCGCSVVGHTSNYDCYVAEMNDDGGVILDDHGFG